MNENWQTPAKLYAKLNREFRFTLDPCPLNPTEDGLSLSWHGHRVFCNPPYDNIGAWLAKAKEAKTAVYLLPAWTDRAWWHQYALKAAEIIFIQGRLKFGGASTSAPFASVILIFKKSSKARPGGLPTEGAS